MKKSIIAFVLVFISVFFPPLGFASAEYTPTYLQEQFPFKDNVFVLPASLEIIEEEAFEETAVTTAVFQNNVIYISDQVFASASKLRSVFIPPSTEFIGENAFPDNTDLIVFSVKGSYAEKWANEHQIPFKDSNIWGLLMPNGKSLNTHGVPLSRVLPVIDPERAIGVTKQTANDDVSMRPQDRPELNPIDYRFP